MATDSAASIPGGPEGDAIAQVYENANKVFQLHRHLPIGAMVWGAGAMGDVTIATIMKDWRASFMGRVVSDDDEARYSIREICKEIGSHIRHDHYAEAFDSFPPGKKPVFGMKVAGYTSGASSPESWTIQIDNNGALSGPTEDEGPPAIMAHATPEPVMRLMMGVTPGLAEILEQTGVPREQAQEAFRRALQRQTANLAHPAMPIQDAIDLAVFLVDLTIKYIRFSPGPPVVGGPIEAAVITKHEHFKWIRRKHYYNRELNVDYPRPAT